jgi:hypothetical protein
MPRFIVEETMSAGPERTEIAASVKDREQIAPHQDMRLDIDQRRFRVNIKLVPELDEVRHGG